MAATPQISLTGTVNDLQGNPVNGGTVTVTLLGYGADIPRVQGVSILGKATLTATVSAGTFSVGTFYSVVMPSPSGRVHLVEP